MNSHWLLMLIYEEALKNDIYIIITRLRLYVYNIIMVSYWIFVNKLYEWGLFICTENVRVKYPLQNEKESQLKFYNSFCLPLAIWNRHKYWQFL